MTDDRRDLETENKELKKILRQLTDDRDKYRQLFEISGDALFTLDLDKGRIIQCNQAAIEMLGVESSESIISLRLSDLSPEYQPCGKRSDEMAIEHITMTVAEGSQLFQWTHSRLDGSTFTCQISLTAFLVDGRNLALASSRDITELVDAKKDLSEAAIHAQKLELAYLEEKEKFEKFVNLAPVGIAINSITDGRFEFVNQTLVDITGYSIEELNQMDYWQLTPRKYEKQESQQLESLNSSGAYGPYLKEYIHKSGFTYPVLLSGIKIVDKKGKESIWSVVQDMSTQKANEQQIQEAKRKADDLALRLQIANDSAEIGVWEWDLLSGELVWDKWMFKLYGISEAEFSGAYEAWVNGVHPDDIEEAKALLEAAIDGKSVYEPEFRVIHPNGTVRNLKASAEVLRDDNGKAIKVVGVNYDITEKTNTMDILSKAKEAAESAAKAKSDFLANMSHEIRTPMNAILGGLQLLKNAELDKNLKTILNNAAFSAQSLLTIINDVLDYSKIESNNLTLEHAPFSLIEIVNSIKYDVNGLVSSKDINFHVDIDDNFTDGWVGDIVRVKQILLNLTSNAVKFTDKGAVTVQVGLCEYGGTNALQIKVIDTGIGMSDEAVARIFDRFSQADSSTTRKYGGTGLGMSITLRLVKMMNGDLSVESSVGEGTAVTVTLPLKQTTLDKKAEVEKSLTAPMMMRKKILVAEDNEINQVVIQTMLEQTKASVKTVDNGVQAVEAVNGEDFDLILMDIQMPEMDGQEAQKAIAALKPHIPVVALTANVMPQDVAKYLKQGFASHLPKPLEMNMLYGLLKQYS